jgi:16S rRNA C1402 (ribose-2'-O) methylase RsmI
MISRYALPFEEVDLIAAEDTSRVLLRHYQIRTALAGITSTTNGRRQNRSWSSWFAA